ncbi:type II secretion system protein J [Psychrobacillus sp. NPDC096623]|uniref:PulJ/GspJ family protein n=1 Tax=Psychrobacillus sp. NPDC096623 TaxID=3364492 RepID=UPI00380CCA36
MFRKTKNTNGFTLVEILASVVLLTVVISLFLSIFPQMSNMNNRNGENLDAANAAKELLMLVKENYTLDDSTNNLKGNILDFSISQNNTTSIIVEGTYKALNDKIFFAEVKIEKNGAISNSKIDNLYQVTIKVKNRQEDSKALATTYGYIRE